MANFNIAYLIELKDRYTKVAQKVVSNTKKMQQSIGDMKDAIVKMNNGIDSARVRLKAFGSSTKKIGDNIHSVGKNLAGISATVGALFWKSLKNYQTQASAIATLDLSMKSRQASLGMTSKQIQQMASEMQGKSIFGDESIIQNVSNQLLTFDKVNGQVFKRANQAVLDMTSKLYGANASAEQMKPMALALGKALNNPAEAMNSLGRVGVKFSKSQQDIVKYLVQTGQSAKAQEFILYQLESRYRGSAEVLGNTQPIKQLTNAFNDMLEPLGQIVQEFLIPLVKIGTSMIATFNKMNKPFKTFVVTVMGLIALASPLLIILGGTISAIGQISTGIGFALKVLSQFNVVAKIATGIQMLFNASLWANPITWVVAGVGLLIIAMMRSKTVFDTVKNTAIGLWDILKGLFFGIKIATVWLWDFLKPVRDVVKFFFMWLTPIGLVINMIKLLITWIDKALSKFGGIAGVMEKFRSMGKSFGDTMQQASEKQNKQRELKSSESNGSSKIDVNINMKAEKGTEVTKQKVVSQGKNKPNVGVNQASKGR